jgi:parallel beta-helix repeat protein
VAAAKGAGFISGYPDGTFRPDNPISRQEAAVIVARLLGLEGSGGQFADHQDIAPWAREAVAAVRAAGIMGGYPDGTFRPQNSLTRAEAVVTLQQALEAREAGEKEPVKEEPAEEPQNVFDQPGVYGPEEGREVIDGDVAVSAAGVILQNITITGDLLLDEGIGEGDVTLKGVTVQGATIVRGGGSNSINIENSNLARLVVTKDGVRIVATGSTRVTVTTLESGAILVSVVDDETGGFQSVTISEEISTSARISLQGSFTEVNVKGNLSQIELASGNVKEMNIEAPVKVTGAGSVTTANIKADGVELEKAPENLNIGEGVKATVAGNEVDGGKEEGMPATETKRVRLAEIAAFSLKVGDTKAITLNTNATTITATSDNESIASVEVEKVEDGFIVKVRGGALGTAKITVTGSRREYRERTISFAVAVEAVEISSVFVEGEAVVGKTLTAVVTPPEATVNYQWQRASKKDGPYTDIDGGTGSAYKLTSADQGRYIRVLATGTGNFTGTQASEPVGPIETPGVVVESFNTHAGDDYKGVNVTFRLRGLVLSQVQSITVKLGAEARVIATNTANMGELRKLGDSTVQFSTPFIVTRGNYRGREWILGAYEGIKPKWVMVTVTGIDGKTYTDTGGALKEDEVPFELTRPVVNTDLERGYFAIQDALEEAEAGNTIEVSRGLYNGDLEISVEGLTLKAAEPGMVTLWTAGDFDPGKGCGGITILADGVTVEGFVIYQSVPQAVIHTRNAKMVTIANNTISGRALGDRSQRGVEIGFGPGEAGHAGHIVIRDNEFSNLYCGVYINQGEGITITGNDFSQLELGGVVFAGTLPVNNGVVVSNNRAAKGNYLLNFLAETGPEEVRDNILAEDTELANWGVQNLNQNRFFPNIQAAVAGAEPGDTIEVAPGKYYGSIIIDKPLTLLGPNAGVAGYSDQREPEAIITVPKAVELEKPEEDASVVITVKASGVTIDGFRITGDNGNGKINYGGYNVQAGYGINTAWNVAIDGLTVQNNIFDCFSRIGMATQRDAISVKYYGQIKNVTVTSNLIENIHDLRTGYGYGMYIQSASGEVKDNVIKNSRIGIMVQPYSASGGGLVKNNNVETYFIGMFYKSAESGTGTWTFAENTVTAIDPPDDVTNPVRWLGIGVDNFPAGADPLYFTNNIVDGSGTSSAHPKRTEVWGVQIGTGVKDNAVMEFAGNTITGVQIGLLRNGGTLDLDAVLANNTFAEGSRVVENMILIPPDSAIYNIEKNKYYGSIQGAIDDAGDGNTILVGPGTYGGNLTIPSKKNNLTLKGANTGVPAGVEAGDRGPESIIKGSITVGSAAGAGRGLTIDGFTINPSAGYGLRLQAAGETTIVNNIITGSAMVEQGIWAEGSGEAHFVIANNTIEEISTLSTADGILIEGSGTRAYISGNLINGAASHEETSAVGIDVARGAKATIVYNKVSGNGCGINLDSSGNTVTDNLIEDNDWGILLTESENSITQNTIRRNTIGVVGINGSHNTATFNRIYDNDVKGVSTGREDGSSLTVTHNWWGTSAVFGVLDQLSGRIEFIPWYVDEGMETLCSNEDMALAAVNVACIIGDEGRLEEVLREYQEVLDLDFTDYDEKLTDDARRRVLQALLCEEGEGYKYPDIAAVRAAFNAAVEEGFKEEPVDEFGEENAGEEKIEEEPFDEPDVEYVGDDLV